MSLQARTLDKENAGVVSRGNKPGEAPSKQVGPTKRKGLSEMGSNQLAAPRSLGGGLKTQQPKATARPMKKKTTFYDEPVEQMFLGADAGVSFRDPLVEHSMTLDLGKDATWSIDTADYEVDYFSRENARFGLVIEETPDAFETDFPDYSLSLPEADLYLGDC